MNTPIERLWQKRVEALKKEHAGWLEATRKRREEYKSLWNLIRLKRKEYKRTERMLGVLYRHLFLIRRAFGVEEKELRKLGKYKIKNGRMDK